MITFHDDQLRLTFSTYDLDEYALFLKMKAVPEYRVIYDDDTFTHAIECPARFAGALGIDRPRPDREPLPLSSHLFDDQIYIVNRALERKRFACWTQCGSGKSLIGLEFARQVMHLTGKGVLVVTLPTIQTQWLEEAQKFYEGYPIRIIGSREKMKAWMKSGRVEVGIVNYEKWNPAGLEDEIVSEAKYLGGLILDEGSKLRNSGGRQKWSLVKSGRGIEYKMSLTATPAPNEVMEFASQASFLEKLKDERDILWTFFRRCEKTHRWTVKAHARDAFYKFMSDWSIFIDDPKRYGFRKDLPDIPTPTVHVHDIPITDEQRAEHLKLSRTQRGRQMLIPMMEPNAIDRLKFAQVARGFRYLSLPQNEKLQERTSAYKGEYVRVSSGKPGFSASLIKREVADGHTVLVWTAFHAEVDVLRDALDAEGVTYEVITGETKMKDRARLIEAYRHGEFKVLITRPQVLAFGINLQVVTSMVFHGFSDSFESYFQAVRRAYRHGQTKPLRIHIPLIKELEGTTWLNLVRKADQHQAGIKLMETSWMASTLRGE